MKFMYYFSLFLNFFDLECFPYTLKFFYNVGFEEYQDFFLVKYPKFGVCIIGSSNPSIFC